MRNHLSARVALTAFCVLLMAGTAQPALGQEPRVLTVQVFVVETVTGEPAPAPRALVRLEGGDDSSETNDKGVTRLFGVSGDKVKLQVMVAGAELCRVGNVAVSATEAVVKILVDKSRQTRCKLIP